MSLKSKVLTAVLGAAIAISLLPNHALAADPIEIRFRESSIQTPDSHRADRAAADSQGH